MKTTIRNKANKLYNQNRFENCLAFLYKNTRAGKFTVWSIILLSFILSGISIVISINIHNSNVAAVGIAVGVAAVGIGVAGVIVAAAGTAGVAAVGVAAAVGVIVAAAAGTAAAVAGVIAGVVIAVVAGNYLPRLICKMILKRRKG